jgi:non-ribosomal peptide synthetase component F
MSTIGVAQRSSPLPLSFAQQRLWFLDRLDGAASAAYHMPAALRLQGSLHTSALRATLARLVARHESLRTCFPMVDGTPQQRIGASDRGFALLEVDLCNLAEAEREQVLEQHRAEEAAARFDLAAGPLIRGRLLRVASDEHVLLITQHHIISDGWSIGILTHELVTLYAAFTAGEPDPMPLPAIQYADYAAWQRQWLSGNRLQEQARYWKDSLAGAPALFELPLDHPRPAQQSYRGKQVALRLSAELTGRLRQLGQRHDATLFMTVLTGWALLVGRLAGVSDVVIGSPVANRQRTEAEGVVGLFVNTLALRVQWAPGFSVARLLQQVRTQMLEAYGHQELPFDQVVELVQPPRSLAHSPVYQAMLTLLPNNMAQGDSINLAGLKIDALMSHSGTVQCDLCLSLKESQDSLVGTLEYASDLFKETTIRRWIAHFETLLGDMVAGDEMEQPVAALELLAPAQRQQLLESFNDTAAPYPQQRCIHQLFEEQVERTPDAVALVLEDRQLTYLELNAQANRVAHHLIGLGIKPDDRVAICVERSLEMVAGLLGILKAGAAYVPLDPAYPGERLSYMLADSAPVVLLTQTALLASHQGQGHSVPVILLDDPAAHWQAQPDGNPDSAALGLTSSHLAYVIYTSGSTGKPKGAMNSHGAVVNRLAWALSSTP